jgi:4-amino-4-deoxy-L-arabinose transferase-like glycosyltransferase
MLRSRCCHDDLIVALFAAAIYVTGVLSPPGLIDDVDAVQAQIARNMLQSGDWVTARLDLVPYLEKAPLPYWLIAISFRIFGVHDWSARLPFAVSAILLALVITAFSSWQ